MPNINKRIRAAMSGVTDHDASEMEVDYAMATDPRDCALVRLIGDDGWMNIHLDAEGLDEAIDALSRARDALRGAR